MKDKVVGKSVTIQQGENEDVALEYELRQSGAANLVGVRRIPKVSVPRDLVSLKVTDIIAFNSEAERAFVELLTAMCDAAGAEGVSVRSVRAEAAYRLGISTETAKRYIEKWCVAPSAPFLIRDGMIFVKKIEKEKQQKLKRKE